MDKEREDGKKDFQEAEEVSAQEQQLAEHKKENKNLKGAEETKE